MSERRHFGLGRLLFVVGVCLLLALLARKRKEGEPGANAASTVSTQNIADHEFGPAPAEERFVRTAKRTIPASAEEIVTAKVSEFGRSRRELARALARRKGVTMTPEIERFFSAVESGKWEDIESTFKVINGGDSSAGHAQTRAPEVSAVLEAIIDAFGAAEQAHDLPAQALLDYGNSILDSLRPEMVYVGGTDSSRWVPALLNDTSEGERHVVITQNGLADSSYLDYVRLQFDGQLSNLTEEDSQAAFKEYVEDAKQRLEHDEKFPDEPKQILRDEEVKMKDGKVEVGGRVAVMAINEKLLQRLLDKNPDTSFALGESFPLRGTYADAAPLGPIMELRASDENAFTPERAAQSIDTWRDTAQRVMNDPTAGTSETSLKTYSHDAVAAANLLAAHEYSVEAEEGYRLAQQLWPGNPESTAALADLMARSGREQEGRKVIDDFSRQFPDQAKAVENLSSFLYSR